jgi:predicted phage terminase large subunit-like protein
LEFTDLAKAISDTAIKWGAGSILVENAGAGIQYIQQYSGKAPAPIIPMETNSKSKEFRFDGVTPMIESGEVWLPKSAPWLADYENEVLSFPNGDDDQVDSTSQYLAWARRRNTYGTRKLKGTNIKRAA